MMTRMTDEDQMGPNEDQDDRFNQMGPNGDQDDLENHGGRLQKPALLYSKLLMLNNCFLDVMTRTTTNHGTSRINVTKP